MIDRRDDSSTWARIDDRGVSEVVAFILVFAIIFGSVGLLYSAGFQSMNDYQESEQLTNAERAMDAYTENVNDVMRYDGVNQRTGELSLRGGTITTGGDGTELVVSPGFDGNDDETVSLGQFKYHDGDEVIAYEGGGLVRASDGGSLLLKQPQLACRDGGGSGDGTAVISLVTVTGDERSIQTTGGLGVTMSVEDRRSEVISDPGEVSISVEDTSYEGAWESALDNEGWEWDDEEEKGTCDADRVALTIVEVEVDY